MDKRAELDELRARRSAEEKVGRENLKCFRFPQSLKGSTYGLLRCLSFCRACTERGVVAIVDCKVVDMWFVHCSQRLVALVRQLVQQWCCVVLCGAVTGF